jgi:3-deoxy-manno-octulosonate cytidylyltransferase (CMP-KDO synthetase)
VGVPGFIVIPARYGSTRFPGKPLALIAGKTLIQRVYERARQIRNADAIWVATDDDRILHHVETFGGRVLMTRGEFSTGTDRIAAALPEIESREGRTCGRVINLQGDEPLIDTAAVERLIDSLAEEHIDIATLASPLQSPSDLENRDIVKVVTDLAGNALYFSRAPIPFSAPAHARRHVGIYAYRKRVIERLASLPPSPLEQAESLEQLRALQNGFKIRVLEVAAPHLGVDRPEDIAKIEHELANR